MTRIIYKNRWGVECEVDASEIVSVEGFAKAAEGEGSSPESSDAEVYAPLPCRPERPISAGWRTIDSVPRDGTHVVLAFGSDHVAEGWWEDADPGAWPWKFVDRGDPASPFAAGELLNGSREVRGGPTHWMPLPPCPAESGGSGGEAVGPSPGPVTPSELTEITRLSEQVKALEGERDYLLRRWKAAEELACAALYATTDEGGDPLKGWNPDADPADLREYAYDFRSTVELGRRFETRAEAAELQLSKAEAQMKGMREALKEIERGDPDDAPDDGTQDHPYRRIARAALQPQEGKE